jgi:phage terminase large subunit GpA-like protein
MSHYDLENFRAIERELSASIKPPPRMTVAEWSKKERVLSKESSARGGRFDPLPYQVEPMDSVCDPTVVSTALQWAAQLGKSEILNNTLGYFADPDPAPCLMMQPTLEMGEAYSKDRLAPMIRDTPALSRLIADPRSRDSGNTLLHKSFPGGYWAICGANSPSALASRPIRIVLCDEVDRYPSSAGAEGDPIGLVGKRQETFPNAVTVLTSTPTIKGLSRIEKEMEGTDKRRWHVRCLSSECRHEHVLKWEQVRLLDENDTTTARIFCPKCDHEHADADRIKMVRAGRWIATAPFNGRRGYYLSGMNTLFPCRRAYKNRLHQAIEEFRKAKTEGPESLRVWWNTYLGETWEEEGERAVDVATLMKRQEDYSEDPLPEKVLVLTAGIDKQADRFEVEVVGHGLDNETWSIRYEIIEGDTLKPETWKALEDFLLQKWKHPCGHDLPIAALMIDAGDDQEEVLDWCQRHGGKRWWPCKGARRYGHPWVFYGRSKKGRGMLYILRVWVAKEELFGRLRVSKPGPGFQHFPKRYEQRYFEQLTAEKKQVVISGGMPSVRFITLGRNEALDCRVYAMGALERLNPSWAHLERRMKMPEQPVRQYELKSPTEKEAPKPPPATKPFARKSWASRY